MMREDRRLPRPAQHPNIQKPAFLGLTAAGPGYAKGVSTVMDMNMNAWPKNSTVGGCDE
jgi:hypothetical protein